MERVGPLGDDDGDAGANSSRRRDAPAPGNEALLDPDRARARRQMADEALHGDNFAARFGAVDFAAQRARLTQGRDVDDDPNRACLRGDPQQKGGVMSVKDYAKQQKEKEERDNAILERERLTDPEERRKDELKRAEEQVLADKQAFAKEAEERARRLEEKKRKLSGAAAAATAPATGDGGKKSKVKKASLSFGGDDEGSGSGDDDW